MTWIGGIESLWKWTPPGASAPAVTLGEGGYRMLEITGLRSLGESEANADARVGAIGENARLSQRRGKSIAISGRIIATSMRELRDLESDLLAAFADDRREGRMDIAPHPSNAELADVSPKFFEARALTCDIPDQQAGKGFTRGFVIGLRAGDPRVWDETSAVHTAETTDALTAYAFA